MAAAFPEAGSTYSYASKSLHPLFGQLSGWVMYLDYFMLPMISLIIIGSTLSALIPSVPYWAWVLSTACGVTALNLRGIEVTTRATVAFNIILAVALVWFLTSAVRAIVLQSGLHGLVSADPFYHAPTFSLKSVMATTPVAVLSFLGFDAISTLAEDSRDPRRHVARATMLTCAVCGGLFIVQSYLGQIIWPDFTKFTVKETAFMEIGRKIGGQALFQVISALVLGQALFAAVTSQVGGSRLMFGMARDGKAPQLFCRLHPVRRTPVLSLVVSAVLQVLGAMMLDLDHATQLVNFGAGIGFMAVNLAVIRHYFFGSAGRESIRVFPHLLAPSLGFIVCLWIWLSLSPMALSVGFFWAGLGLLYAKRFNRA
jgi:amino acid transporter